jgi:thiol-disulfide isomerase/thioredoxin
MSLRNFLKASDHGRAPNLDKAIGWLNSPPLTSADLRGHVVAYDFWTYTCVNWLRTLPYLRGWAQRYDEHGLIVIGIHTPEFGFEGEIENVRQAVLELDVEYPVVADSNYAIWQAFDNHYWPALYIADGDGVIRYHHFGEGAYEQSERIIQQLLQESGDRKLPSDLTDVNATGVEVAADWDHLESPETYLGAGRGERFAGHRDEDGYRSPSTLHLNHWALEGAWTIRPDAAILDSGSGTIAYRFRARDVNLVLASSAGNIPFRVRLDGQTPDQAHGADCDERGNGVLSQPRLYQLVRQRDRPVERTFEVTFDAPGAAAYAFTFG